MPCVRLPLRTWRWSLAGGGSIGNLSGHSLASALSPGKITSVNMPPRNLSFKHGGAPYRCGDVSIRTALLFRLLGRTAPCWTAAAGSDSRLSGTSCGTPLVYGDQR